MLDVFRPDVAIVMVGANDFWTVPVAVENPSGLIDRAADMLGGSRVYQLVHMFRRAYDSRLEVISSRQLADGSDATLRYGNEEVDVGWRKAELANPGYGSALEENLRAMQREARDAGVHLVLMTYPSRMSNYGGASDHIRKVANEEGIALIDLAALFEPLCPKEPCPALLVADHHPNASGYHLIAETLVKVLPERL
jgi:lysophospholipase L1-like esterase